MKFKRFFLLLISFFAYGPAYSSDGKKSEDVVASKSEKTQIIPQEGVDVLGYTKITSLHDILDNKYLEDFGSAIGFSKKELQGGFALLLPVVLLGLEGEENFSSFDRNTNIHVLALKPKGKAGADDFFSDMAVAFFMKLSENGQKLRETLKSRNLLFQEKDGWVLFGLGVSDAITEMVKKDKSLLDKAFELAQERSDFKGVELNINVDTLVECINPRVNGNSAEGAVAETEARKISLFLKSLQLKSVKVGIDFKDDLVLPRVQVETLPGSCFNKLFQKNQHKEEVKELDFLSLKNPLFVMRSIPFNRESFDVFVDSFSRFLDLLIPEKMQTMPRIDAIFKPISDLASDLNIQGAMAVLEGDLCSPHSLYGLKLTAKSVEDLLESVNIAFIDLFSNFNNPKINLGARYAGACYLDSLVSFKLYSEFSKIKIYESCLSPEVKITEGDNAEVKLKKLEAKKFWTNYSKDFAPKYFCALVKDFVLISDSYDLLKEKIKELSDKKVAQNSVGAYLGETKDGEVFRSREKVYRLIKEVCGNLLPDTFSEKIFSSYSVTSDSQNDDEIEMTATVKNGSGILELKFSFDTLKRLVLKICEALKAETTDSKKNAEGEEELLKTQKELESVNLGDKLSVVEGKSLERDILIPVRILSEYERQAAC